MMETPTLLAITVRLYARYREVAGVDHLNLGVPDGARVADLWPLLVAACPTLVALDDLVAYSGFAVNDGWARPTTPLHAGDDVVLIPPVSGG